MKATIAITGASGYLGSHLCREFLSRGWCVRAGVRDPRKLDLSDPNLVPFRCHLPDEIDETLLSEADACIHAAYTTRFTSLAEAQRVNEQGTKKVLAVFRRKNPGQFVFISSCSAHPLARSYYGRSKLMLEGLLNPESDLVLRLGLVLGKGGLFGRLLDSVRRSRFIPVFDGGRQIIQTIHVKDSCRAIALAIETRVTGKIILAHPKGITMRDLLEIIAQRLGKKPVFLPLPTAPALALLKMTEAFRIRLPLSSENLLGLMSSVFQDSRESLARLGIELRSTRESIEDLMGSAG
jgi:nucleoside-diphosphate-sugar epimerase